MKRARQCNDDEKVVRWNKRGPRGKVGLPGRGRKPRRTRRHHPDRERRTQRSPLEPTATTTSTPNTAELFGPKADGQLAGGRHLAARQHRARRPRRSQRATPDPPATAGSGTATAGTERHASGNTTIRNGTAAPGDGVGNVGDFFLDTSTSNPSTARRPAGGWGAWTPHSGNPGHPGREGRDKGQRRPRATPGSGNIYSCSSALAPGVVSTRSAEDADCTESPRFLSAAATPSPFRLASVGPLNLMTGVGRRHDPGHPRRCHDHLLLRAHEQTARNLLFGA